MKLLFHHIPKAGGTSMAEMLNAYRTPPQGGRPDDAGDPDVVACHHLPYWQVVQEWPGRESIVVMREPTSRTASQYSWLRGTEGAYAEFVRDYSIAEAIAILRDAVEADEMIISDEYPGHPQRLWDYLFNKATMQMGSQHREKKPIIGEKLNFGWSPVEESFERAQEVMRSMYWIGFQETYRQDCLRLFDRLGLKSPVVHANRSKKLDLSAADRRAIDEVNVWDQKLYEYTLDLTSG